MPVGVADYNTYISLSVAAPELIGRWKMVPMPGIDQGGVINRSAGGGAQTVMMFQETQHKQEAWQYIKWWLSAPVQQRYANEIQALLGVSARWNTSNVDAMRSLPWPQSDIQSILGQWDWFQENPVVLGGYYTPIYLTNALEFGGAVRRQPARCDGYRGAGDQPGVGTSAGRVQRQGARARAATYPGSRSASRSLARSGAVVYDMLRLRYEEGDG